MITAAMDENDEDENIYLLPGKAITTVLTMNFESKNGIVYKIKI